MVPAAEPAAAASKGAAPAAAKEAGITAGIEAASNTYSEAFNAHDLIALADQWTTDAELVEGGSRLSGRERIMESLGTWLNSLRESHAWNH
jgi:ketosteroid isomerase-like protein